MSTLPVRELDAPALVARSLRIADPGPLLALLPQGSPLAWLRQGEGLVGWGAAARCESAGPDRFAAGERWWSEVCSRSVVRDEVRLAGSGLVSFGSFAFADEPGSSVLVVPRVVVGRRKDTCWVTAIGSGALPESPALTRTDPPQPPDGVAFLDGARSGADWASAVSDAVTLIANTALEKVVLARDLLAQAGAPIDVRWPVQRLAEAYPSCWTFHIDRLFGATPEMLIRRERGLVTSRVLAGTIRRTGDDTRDLALAAALARSSKDLEEHEYAVRSVAEVLGEHCTSTNVPETPFVLHLPNVMHLATDVTGVLADDTTSLGLATALHPSAAVGGTPTELAVDAIADLEGMDRGRYAGPVGWLGANGDGEWGIALRCGRLEGDRLEEDRLEGDRVRLYAGCGIVAGSDPQTELAEAQAKFVPVRDALGGRPCG